MTLSGESSWIVLKFGGTSVSTLENWRNVAAVVRARLAEGYRVLVVHSALSGETDRLEKLLSAAFSGTHEALLALIEERHLTLAAQLGIDSSAKLENYFADLRQIAASLAQR